MGLIEAARAAVEGGAVMKLSALRRARPGKCAAASVTIAGSIA
jgi:hypothetical protein